MIGKLFKIGVICFVVFAAFRLGQVFALTDPDTIRIESVNRYDDVAITGDLFIVVEYTISYAAAPDESISEGFLGRLIDQDGTGPLATVKPFDGAVIPNSGYDRGVFGFYFATEPSVTGTLRVDLGGNPSLDPTPDGIFTESIETRATSDLEPDLRELALRLETAWSVDLVTPEDGGINRYTTSGEEYFNSALPNLRNLAPDMFIVQNIEPEVVDQSYDTTFADSREALFDGTIVGDGFTDLGTFLGVSRTVAEFLFVTIIVIFSAIGLGKAIGDTDWTVQTQIWAGMVIYFAGAWMGLITWPVLGVMAVVAIVATGVVLFFQRAS